MNVFTVLYVVVGILALALYVGIAVLTGYFPNKRWDEPFFAWPFLAVIITGLGWTIYMIGKFLSHALFKL